MASKIAILTRRPILSGLIYGDVIYLVMNFVILPVSGVPHPKSTTTIATLVNGVLALMLCVGLPISVLTARTYPRAIAVRSLLGFNIQKILDTGSLMPDGEGTFHT
jgi:protein-S-isoprenylcysteine O-methyltransferase Ste14